MVGTKVIRDILVLYGRIFHLYRNGIYNVRYYTRGSAFFRRRKTMNVLNEWYKLRINACCRGANNKNKGQIIYFVFVVK